MTCLFGSLPVEAYLPPSMPFAPAAGQKGSTAVAHDDQRILSWAAAVQAFTVGGHVEDSELWKDPSRALGPAEAVNPGVLVLGRGGAAVLEFVPLIADGPGDDFVVFENGFSDTFLELAYVEVSSDGEHFVRFPSYSLTAQPVGSWGDVSASFVHGFAGKYRAGYGTPFDLSVLAEAHAAAKAGTGGFSEDYRSLLLANFPFLELDSVRYVRLIDIVGDGSATDCEGFSVFDPYPTFITAGFDLDAVGVLNEGSVPVSPYEDWLQYHGLSASPEGDFDADGWSQRLEYLMGSHPRDSGSVPLLELAITEPGLLRLRLATSRTAAGTVQVESSGNGADWTPRPAETTGNNGLFQYAEVTVNPGGTTDKALLFRVVPRMDP